MAPESKQPPGWPPDWFIDLTSRFELSGFHRDRVLMTGQTKFQAFEIFENRLWGRMLILDGRLQSAELDEFIYHEALVHPAMLAHPDPRRVLIMGGGEGATLREVLRHREVERAVMVDIDAELVGLCKEWLPTFHAGAFDDPRTELAFADGRDWLLAQADASLDVIILDLPEPLEEGPALKLFTREMYELVRSKLAPRGLMAVQSGSAGLQGHLMTDLNATLRAVFPMVVAYTAFVPSFMDLYGFHVAGGRELAWPGPAAAAARLKERGLTALKWLGADYFASLPCLPRFLEARLAREGKVLTDARPFGTRPGEPTFY
ncbi:MAG: spermidine synthase [Deltaproteobacteria bacterium]